MPVWGKQPASHSGQKSGPSSSEVPRDLRSTKNRRDSLLKGTESTPRSSTNTITDDRRDSFRDLPVKCDTTEAQRASSSSNAEKESEPLENESTDLDPRAYRTVHSKFRQFLVEGFNTGRSRTKSEYPSNNTHNDSSRGNSMRMNKPEDTNSASSQSKEDLPLHAYTVTGGSTQGTSLLRRLAAYTNLSGTQSDQASIRSGTDSLRRALHGHMGRSHHASEGRSGSVPTPPDYAILPRGSDKSHHHRSPRGMIGRLMSMSSGSGKSTEDIILPDPSKLPREHPCSTIEFTQTRLKDPKRIPQKFQVKSGIDVLRRQRAGSISGTSGDSRNLYANARPFILDHASKSEETLLSIANAKGRRATAFVLTPSTNGRHNSGSEKLSGTQLSIEQEEQEEQPVPNPSDPQGRRHGNHGHHRTKGHHGHHSVRKSHTMTRVTESRRYLMFTKTLPFWTTKQYMEAHGTGMGDAETYALLFRHTTCYELMPESAKLVVLDNQLTISKAFKALIYNGIRAAPIWDSTAQTNVAMLTITDFVHMLYQFWDASDTMEIGDFDRLTIQKWKEVGKTENRNNLSAQNLSSSLKSDTTVELVESKSISNGEVSPPCNPSSHPGSRRSSVSCSTSSSSSSRSSAASLPPTLSDSQEADQQDVSQAEISAASEGDIQSPCYLPSLVHSRTAGAQTPIRFRSVCPESSLYKCLRIMSRFHLHHLPVIDSPHLGSGNVLYILTLHRLLVYMLSQISQLPQPRFLQSSLADLNVGTLTNVTVVTPNTRLAEVLPLFESKQVSALPVVESMASRRLINLVSKYDIIALVSSGSFNNPELTIQDWLNVCRTKGSPTSQHRGRPPVETCLATNNLLFVIERLVSTGFRRLVIVNNTTEYRVDGIVSLFDVLRFAVLSQPRSGHSHPAPPPSVAEVAEEHDEVVSESEDSTHQTKSSSLVRTGTITPKHSLDSGTNRGGTVRHSPDPAPCSGLRCTTGSRQKRNQNPEIKLHHVEDEVCNPLTSHVLMDEGALSSA
ncbi:unnamed protein product [Calicophoron daubneyi]|uniref:CBS domain-containing protein n=1 Tax=Calicophoron daubneyi TaxID=300641 RepID=A0AAV2TWP5_CALDB